MYVLLYCFFLWILIIQKSRGERRRWTERCVLRETTDTTQEEEEGKKKRGQKTLLSLSPLSLQKKENAHPHALIREAHTKKHDGGASIAFKSKSNKKNRKDRKYTHTCAIIIIISSSSSSTKN